MSMRTTIIITHRVTEWWRTHDPWARMLLVCDPSTSLQDWMNKYVYDLGDVISRDDFDTEA